MIHFEGKRVKKYFWNRLPPYKSAFRTRKKQVHLTYKQQWHHSVGHPKCTIFSNKLKRDSKLINM